MREKHTADHETSRIAKAIVVLVCVVPVAATIAYGAVDSWSIGLLSVMVAIVALLWLIDAGFAGEFRYSTNAVQLPIVALLAIGCVQLLPLGSEEAATLVNAPAAHALSMDPYATRFFLIRLVICFVFFAAALVYVPGGKRQNRIAALIITFGTLIAFFGILQRLSTAEAIYGLRQTPQAISFGPFVNQHHFASLMVMTSGIVLGLLFGGGIARERKILLGLAAAIMGMAIIFTGSRGGLISYLGVVVLTAVASFTWHTDSIAREDQDSRSRSRRNLLILTAAGGLLLLVIGSVLFLGGEGAVLRVIGLQPDQSDVTSGRGHFWGVAWQIFLANPILGAGFDAFGVAFPRYDTWNGQFRVEQAHNDYLQILADGGVVSLACVVAFVFIFVRKGIASISRRTSDLNRSVSTGALAGCFGILVHSFFDFPLRTPANAFFFLLLVVLAVGNDAGAKRSRRS
ncbi:MAG TPA: O-antigen ligase family protein [Pyrinomonadaceae bacterium]|nr:O-antigen ligase family protein [Pyrinomonadaceae bacterium]